MPSDSAAVGAASPAYSGVFVFGDSLVDPGNDLRAAQAIGAFPFGGLPNGAPSADKGYFEGRFTDGYNFADLISNKFIDQPTRPTFPYGLNDPVFGLSIPLVNRPEGNNLSFAYGGAKAVEGLDLAPSLPDQTAIYRNFTADPNALYVISIGANDVLALVPKSGDPVTGAAAQSELSQVARTITEEVARLFGQGARHVVVADVPDVGVTPGYSGVADEALRRGLLSDYAHTANSLLKADLAALALPAGATLLDYDFFGFADSATANPASHAFTNVTDARTSVQGAPFDPPGGGFLFFDKLHPSAQAHAQIAGEILDSLRSPEQAPHDALPPAIGAQAAAAIPVGGAGSFAASLVGGHTYVVDAVGVSNGLGSLADPMLRVLNASGALVGADDDGGLGLDSHLQFTAASTGDYTMEVSGVGVAGGSYRLQAEDVAGGNLLLAGALRGSNVAVAGGGANDTIAALAGANVLHGGDGDDSITGGTGFDKINGNRGDDVLVGQSRVGDWLLGGQGDDLIDATQSSGHDLVNGNLGADTLAGGPGGDTLRGGQGDDAITGGVGADWLSGDLGVNTLTGGGGADIFNAGGGVDRVTDFSAAEGDRVRLDAGTTYVLSQDGADAVLSLSGGGRMTLAGVSGANLPAGWIFAG